jgi:hypothetical protein
MNRAVSFAGLQVEVEPGERGYLRPAKFDEKAHSILSEELKHLYTAITRAKNNVRSPYARLCGSWLSHAEN